MVLVWAAAAVVFISPDYVGIAVMALVKVLALQFVVHTRQSIKVRVCNGAATVSPRWQGEGLQQARRSSLTASIAHEYPCPLNFPSTCSVSSRRR